MPADPQVRDTDRWCAGLRMAAHRRISAEETLLVGRMARTTTIAAACTAGCVLASMTVTWALIEHALRPGLPHQRPYLLVAAGLTVGLLTPLLALLTARRIRLARLLRADLAEGRVEGYLGAVEYESVDDGQRRLVDGGLLTPDANRQQCLEVLPNSHTILRVNGNAASRRIVAECTELAATQPHRFATPLPRDLIDVLNDGGLDLKRRSLSPAEMAELGGHAERFRRRFRLTTALAAASAAALGSWFSHAIATASPDSRLSPILAQLLGWAGAVMLLAIVAALGYALWLRITHRIEADQELSWVITVRDVDAEAREPRFEILPASRLLWTEGTRPAGWRFDAR